MSARPNALMRGPAGSSSRSDSHSGLCGYPSNKPENLDQFAIACVGQFAKLSHDHRPIAAACPYTQLQSDLIQQIRRWFY